MDPALAKIRSEMKRCEELIVLCDRIKQLEKLQDGRLEAKRARLEQDIAELAKQKQLTSTQIQRFEASLDVRDRIVSAYELSQVAEQLKTAQVRLGIVDENVASLSTEIESITDRLQQAEAELNGLYPALEQFIADGLNPDTVNERLAELKREKERVAENLRSIRQDNAAGNLYAADGESVGEAQFFACLQVDLATARKSIEVVSQQLNVERAAGLMSELARFAAAGVNVSIYTSPVGEQTQSAVSQLQKVIVNAHRQRISMIQRSGIEYNAVIIDKRISWEGLIHPLANSPADATMKRMSTSNHIRELRYYLFDRVR